MLNSTPELLELPLALLAGVFTVASPCILPIMPIVLGSAVGPQGRRPLFIVAGFVLAFASFAMLLGAASSLAGVAQGMQMIRVHDVPETRQALLLWQAVNGGEA